MFSLLDCLFFYESPCMGKDRGVSHPPVDETCLHRDVILVIFKNLSLTELGKCAFVSKKWLDIALHPALKVKEIGAFSHLLRRPELLNDQPVRGEIAHHKGNFFAQESFEMNGKIYKKPRSGRDIQVNGDKAMKHFLVDLSLNLKQVEAKALSPEQEAQALCILERAVILLSTQGKVQSDFAYLPIQWTFHSSKHSLNEEGLALVNKIKLEIEDFNKKSH